MPKLNGISVIRAVRFYEEIRKGSSLPLLIGGDDGNSYVVKLNGAGDGVLSNVVEWVASKLGALMQIPVLQPVFVVIDANLAGQAGDPETRELLERSVGINLGTPYLPDAATYSAEYASSIDDVLRQQIFLFDLFLINIDRTGVNPNMDQPIARSGTRDGIAKRDNREAAQQEEARRCAQSETGSIAHAERRNGGGSPLAQH